MNPAERKTRYCIVYCLWCSVRHLSPVLLKKKSTPRLTTAVAITLKHSPIPPVFFCPICVLYIAANVCNLGATAAYKFYFMRPYIKISLAYIHHTSLMKIMNFKFYVIYKVAFTKLYPCWLAHQVWIKFVYKQSLSKLG